MRDAAVHLNRHAADRSGAERRMAEHLAAPHRAACRMERSCPPTRLPPLPEATARDPHRPPPARELAQGAVVKPHEPARSSWAAQDRLCRPPKAPCGMGRYSGIRPHHQHRLERRRRLHSRRRRLRSGRRRGLPEQEGQKGEEGRRRRKRQRQWWCRRPGGSQQQ